MVGVSVTVSTVDPPLELPALLLLPAPLEAVAPPPVAPPLLLLLATQREALQICPLAQSVVCPHPTEHTPPKHDNSLVHSLPAVQAVPSVLVPAALLPLHPSNSKRASESSFIAPL